MDGQAEAREALASRGRKSAGFGVSVGSGGGLGTFPKETLLEEEVMQRRLAKSHWMAIILCAGALAVAPFAFAATGGQSTDRGSSTVTAKTANGAGEEAAPSVTVRSFERTIEWWPYTTGPTYETLSREDLISKRGIALAVGGFTPDRPLAIPAELTGSLAGISQGYAQYFLVKLAGEGEQLVANRQALQTMGAVEVGQVPVNALVVRLDKAAYESVANSPAIDFIEPFHPAYRISPSLGTAPMPTQEAANSPILTLELLLFEGEPVAPVAQAAGLLGANVLGARDSAGQGVLVVAANAALVPELAKLEAVAMIFESLPKHLEGGRGTIFLQSRADAAIVGDFKYWKAGVDGDNQVIAVQDSGLSVDAGDFADTRPTSGWTGSSPCRVTTNHRKVVCYKDSSEYGAGSGGGDLSACDSAVSESFTHGQVVAGIAAGNATRDEVPAPPQPQVPGLGAGFYDDGNSDGRFDELNDSAYDGVAKGAKVVMIDAVSGCPDNIESGVFPGDMYRVVTETWTEFDATIHNNSWGSVPSPSGPEYNIQALNVDRAVFDNPINLVTWSAGNEGEFADVPFDGGVVTVGTVGDQKTCKNCIAVGASNGLGDHWFFTSKGPCGTGSAAGRVCPLLFAEGFDNACRSEDEGTEDQTGVAVCRDSGNQQGTSFAAPNMAGAAALVRDYFQKGFYPDGTDQNSSNAADQVGALSAHALRAILITSAIPITTGRTFVPPDRFNNIWGYGQVVLSRALPLSGDPETVSGLIIHDDPGDIDKNAGNDGVSDLDFTPTIAPSSEQSSIVEVLSDEEDLVVALTWLEEEGVLGGGAMINDIDLRVEYCGTDSSCATVENTWYGNIFSEDFDRDGDADFDIEGSPEFALTGYHYSIDSDTVIAVNGSLPAGFKDPSNNNEAVFIPRVETPSIVDQNGDGAPDIAELAPGFYRIVVEHVSGPDSPLFAVAIAGPVAAGSSVRLDTNPLACNSEVGITVNERADGADTDCADKDNCPASVINSRVTVRVKDASDAVVDTESNVVFQQVDSGAFQYETADRLPLTVVGVPSDNDGILTVNDGYSIEVEYSDFGATRISQGQVDCRPQLGVSLIQQLGRDESFVLAGGCDGDRYLDEGENLSLELQYFNLDSVDLIDAELELRAVLAEDPDSPSYDDDTDLCRTNNPVASFITIDNPSRTVGLLPGAVLQRSGFTLRVSSLPPQRQQVDLVVALSGAKTGQQVEDCLPLTFLAQADDETNRYITDCPTGCVIDRDINNDEVIEDRVARNPADPLDFINRNLDESAIEYGDLTDTSFRTVDGDGDGEPDCPQCGNPGFNGPWDFDTDSEGFRSGISPTSETSGSTITNWGEDENFDGVLQTSEDKDGDGVFDQNWGTGGGCGWTSANGTSRGMWHTGSIGNWQPSHRTAACRPQDSICEQYDTQTGTLGEELWGEFLRSPVVRPVRSGFDNDGYEWQTQVVDWSWNMQIDNRDTNVSWFWEFDLDTEDGDPTLLGDNFIQGGFGGASGLIAGGQNNLFGGAIAFLPNETNPSDPNYGNEKLSTIGGNRDAARGCYFAELDLIAGDGPGLFAADRQVARPRPFDDDCDNNYTFGNDGCPGLCGVDDDGDGAVDEQDETCPCLTCDSGPKAGQACLTNANCRIAATDTAVCLPNTNASGDPIGFGDDECGTAAAAGGAPNATDEYVTDFGGVPTVRQYRNASLALNNGIAGGGRGGGDPRFNALEDFYGEGGQSWSTELGFFVYEQEPGDNAPIAGYGLGIDDMVIEWQETHPIGQTVDACSVANEDYRDQCARVALGVAFNTFDGDGEIPVAVIDFNAAGSANEVDCNGDEVANEIEVFAYSEAEPDFETYCLEPAAPGSTEYVGTIKTTTRLKKGGDGLVYLAWNGSDTPSVSALYIDKETDQVGFGNGPDGQPGIAGYDDDGDGQTDEADELCPLSSTLGPGRSPHRAGQAARYSDDECGCPDNPRIDTTATAFDPIDIVVTDWDVDDSSCAGCDNDGFPDPGEKVSLGLTLRNFSSFPIENLELILASDSPLVDCVTDDRETVLRIERQDPDDPGDIVTLAADAFEFIAADGVDRSSIGEEFSSTWTLSLRGLAKADGTSSLTDDLPISGSLVVQSFRIPHNLDAPSPTSAPDFLDRFETYGTDFALRDAWVPYVTGDDAAELDGTRCQTNDPANPFGNNTDPADFCQLGEGYDNTEEHWHLHGPGPGTCEIGTCPDGGRSYPDGGASSLSSSNIAESGFLGDRITIDLNRMNWVQYFENFQLGLGEPELTAWMQMSNVDSRIFGDGGGWAWDAAGLYVCVDTNDNNECDTGQVGTPDNGETWEIVRPYVGPSQGFRLNNFINCMYDPSDDGTTEDMFFPNSDDTGPSSTCFPGNPVDTCVGRTLEEGAFGGVPANVLLPICWPETGNEADEIASGNAIQDVVGRTWVRRQYRLDKWRGQKVLVRFHQSPGGLAGIENLSDFAGPTVGNLDDGWFIDNVEITGLANDIALSVDNAGTTNNECASLAACTTIDANVAVVPYPRVDRRGDPRPALACSNPSDIDTCDFDNDGTVDTLDTDATSNAPGRPFVLDARFTDAPLCLGGALEYRFVDVTNGTVLRDWLTDTELLVNPETTTTYSVEVRCSADPSCAAAIETTITAGPDDCSTSDLLIGLDKSTITWQQPSSNACPAIFDTAKSGAAASGYTCFENDGADTSSFDSADPAPGSAFFYLSRVDGDTWTGGGAGEDANRDTNVDTCN